ncbi:MAG: TIGR04282 family arsenosugar biosynthesis glycosyltransferase [Bacteroidetes bacterium]|nr:TIGR04282 family arsenosugar biosynthesis glycosyltransferase [Bacteroidota bacterium]
MNKDKDALIVFVKNPILGNVKTRLAQKIGLKNALRIYQKLLNHTLKIILPLTQDVIICYSEEVIIDDMWTGHQFLKEKQIGIDLGDKMSNAFKDYFSKGYKKICIIGSDNLEITTEIIEQAFHVLNETDIVIGPADDGGYYLAGMKAQYSEIFKNKSWSTSRVLEETINDLKDQTLSYSLLKTLSDIDTYKDLKKAIDRGLISN